MEDIKKFEEYDFINGGDKYWEYAKKFVSYYIDGIEKFEDIEDAFDNFCNLMKNTQLDKQYTINFDSNEKFKVVKEVETLCTNLHLNSKDLYAGKSWLSLGKFKK